MARFVKRVKDMRHTDFMACFKQFTVKDALFHNLKYYSGVVAVGLRVCSTGSATAEPQATKYKTPQQVFTSRVKCHHNQALTPRHQLHFLPSDRAVFTWTSRAELDCKLHCVCCLAAGQKFMVMLWVMGQAQEGGGHWWWQCGDCVRFQTLSSWPGVSAFGVSKIRRRHQRLSNLCLFWGGGNNEPGPSQEPAAHWFTARHQHLPGERCSEDSKFHPGHDQANCLIISCTTFRFPLETSSYIESAYKYAS